MAIYEKPFFGYGPYAEDLTMLKYRVYNYFNFDVTYNQYLQMYKSQLGYVMVPRHSYVGGAMVFCGILALPFWYYYIKNLFKNFVKNYVNKNNAFKLLLLICVFDMTWEIFFSPLQNRTNLVMLFFS